MTALTSRKATPEKDTRLGLRVTAQHDLYYLARYILGYRDMTDAFHKPMLAWSQTEPARKKLHMAARGTYKSSGLNIAKSIQYIFNHPDHCSLIGSNKAENAQKFLREITGHLQNNDKLMWTFPEILWTNPRDQGEHYLKGALTVKRPKGMRPRKEATIDTNGVEGELVSNHYERGVFDDLVGFENVRTRPERMKVIDWYETAQALVDQPTPEEAAQDIIGTPWDYDDLYAHLLKKRAGGEIKLAVYFIPCWLPDVNGTEVPGRGPMRATFPEKLSVPVLIQLRKAMPLRFAALFELTPADEETTVFKRVPVDDKHPWGIPAIKPRREMPPLQSMWLAITIDPAISEKGWANYSALTVCGWDHENTQHVLWLKWGLWSETQLIEETYLAYNHFAARGNTPVVIGIEVVAFQKLYKSLFVSAGEKRGHHLPVTKLERDTKYTKQTRQLVLEPGWNAGEIVLYDDLDALDGLLDMASKFRVHKELTRDDLLDVLADNHQLRVRPNAPDPLAAQLQGLDVEQTEMVRYMVTTQARRQSEGQAPLDEASLRMAWLTHRHFARIEEERLMTTLGVSADSEVWA